MRNIGELLLAGNFGNRLSWKPLASEQSPASTATKYSVLGLQEQS